GYVVTGRLPPARQRVNRLTGLLGSATLPVLCAPLFGVISLVVRLSSPGSAVFRQARVGRGGRVFYVRKFRTMYFDAEEQLRIDDQLYAAYTNNQYKVPRHLDFRVTRVGRILRLTSLDELPQLLNVLRGEMSLV